MFRAIQRYNNSDHHAQGLLYGHPFGGVTDSVSASLVRIFGRFIEPDVTPDRIPSLIDEAISSRTLTMTEKVRAGVQKGLKVQKGIDELGCFLTLSQRQDDLMNHILDAVPESHSATGHEVAITFVYALGDFSALERGEFRIKASNVLKAQRLDDEQLRRSLLVAIGDYVPLPPKPGNA